MRERHKRNDPTAYAYAETRLAAGTAPMTNPPTLSEEAMSHADWLRVCIAWLDDKSMRPAVIEHLEDAADEYEFQAETITAQAKRIEELREALKPFAKECENRRVWDDAWPIGGSGLVTGDLRRARRALGDDHAADEPAWPNNASQG